MKKIPAVCVAVLLLFLTQIFFGQEPGIIAAQGGIVKENLWLESKLLGQNVNYSIYLPSDYETSSRRYPTVYLLHGFTDNETAWIQFGEVNLAADRAIAAREIPPMIIVMPDAGITWYINDYANKKPFEDMFFQELIPFIDKTYRTRPKKEFRAVAGLSMGGWGSLVYALKHPSVFAACVPFSAGVYANEDIIAMDDGRYDYVFTTLFGISLKGTARVNEHWQKYSPMTLMETLPVDSLKSVRWYIDCGDDDFLSKGNNLLHILMRERNVPHEFRVRDGAHNWEYWRTGISDGLKFIGASFHR